MADEVQRRTGIGVLRQLLGHLLHAIFAQGVDAGGNGLPTGGGVIHLAGTHQRDVRGSAAAALRRQSDLLPDGSNVFGNRHGNSSLAVKKTLETIFFLFFPYVYALFSASGQEHAVRQRLGRGDRQIPLPQDALTLCALGAVHQAEALAPI